MGKSAAVRVYLRASTSETIQAAIEIAIKEELKKMAENNLFIDALTGGNATYNSLERLASLFAQKADAAIDDYNRLKEIYTRCCQE